MVMGGKARHIQADLPKDGLRDNAIDPGTVSTRSTAS
jgi:hypothetical protein